MSETFKKDHKGNLSPGLKRKKCKKAPPVTAEAKSQAVLNRIRVGAEFGQLSGSVIESSKKDGCPYQTEG